MSEPTRPHSRKFLPPLLRFLVPAAIMAIVLTGCTAAPEAPVQTTQSAEKYRAGLEDFSRRMLDLGSGRPDRDVDQRRRLVTCRWGPQSGQPGAG